ncbi:MAG: valine--tRNA ligase, partial [Bdellovibrionales bacterium]
MLDKTFDPKSVEETYYKEWEASGVFAANPESSENPFTIMMPPPNVTGSLHIGHALNHTLQDILIRYNRMKGKDTLWQPGTDHASIAVHMVLERQLAEEGSTRQKLGREGFMERAWKWKEECRSNITGQLRRLGTTPDWGRERFTMDDGLSNAVRKVFVQLYNEGIIYRANRLVNWDPKTQTVLSDLEVEQKEVKGNMWYIDYPLEGENELYITVATTRPETLLGDTGIAVHPEDERFKHLIGKFAVVPIVNRPVQIVGDEHCDPEKGTGAVKITPAHDFNDFEVGKRHDLPVINIFDETAHLNENTPKEYQGMERFEARKKVLEELEELELLKEVESIKHAVPYDEKSKSTIVEPFLTEQWYVDAETLAKPALEAVRSGKTQFVPKQWENTYFAWLENIQPWCISRQLWWGHRIPAWFGPNDEIYVAETEEEAMAQARESHGEDVPLRQEEDVLDTWFSSALWPFSTLGWPEKTPELEKYYPGDVLITSFDIIFFWVARMMMMGIHFMGEVPFKTVYMHALVRDEKGQKMSKSKGNVVDPLDLIEKFGTDAVRFALTAMAAQGRDIRISEQRVEGYRNFATKLWNAARFCEMNGCKPIEGFDPKAVTDSKNQWIISELIKTKAEIEKGLDDCKFNDSALAIYQFAWGTFCDWYVELIKPVFEKDDEIATETRATAAWVLDQILTLLNPFMPYVTEELYKSLGERGGQNLISGAWPDYSAITPSKDAQADLSWVLNIISEIRSVRADMNVPAGAKIALQFKDADDQTRTRFETYEEAILRLARLESITEVSEVQKGALQTVVGKTTLI